jgi:hypothetical protein
VLLIQRNIKHTSVGGGGQLGGYDALDYRRIKQGETEQVSNCSILAVLPDKLEFARFLFEFHADRFQVHLPHLRDDKSDFDVHGALEDDDKAIQTIMTYSQYNCEIRFFSL